MTSWRTYILVWLLLGSALVLCQAQADRPLTSAEYLAELDGLLANTKQLDSNGRELPDPLKHLPQNWSVHTDNGDFEISTEGLRRDVRRYEEERNEVHSSAIRTRLEGLRREITGFEKEPPSVSNSRTELNAILARPEFRDVHGPTWSDRLKRWMLEKLFHLLGKLFRPNVIPTFGKYFVYGLMGLAVMALLYLVYRSILRNQGFEEVVPRNLPVSAKEWTIWLSEGRAAAAKDDWREAVHLAYWAGISFLEQQGCWKPDRARTPREYLRLISVESEQRETLLTLTQIFELAWYAERPAGETTFSQTLEQLEKLGCH